MQTPCLQTTDNRFPRFKRTPEMPRTAPDNRYNRLAIADDRYRQIRSFALFQNNCHMSDIPKGTRNPLCPKNLRNRQSLTSRGHATRGHSPGELAISMLRRREAQEKSDRIKARATPWPVDPRLRKATAADWRFRFDGSHFPNVTHLGNSERVPHVLLEPHRQSLRLGHYPGQTLPELLAH